MKTNRMAGGPETQRTVAPASTSDTQYFSVSEAAELLRARRWTIAAAIREKKLPYIKLGKKFVLLRADLDAFALANRVETPNKRG
jgi:excisionase family DNA binding protein